MTRLEQFLRLQKETAEIFARKNHDYGDSFAKYGPIGVLVRIGDKIERAVTLEKRGINLVDESVRDTLVDLSNYALMAAMLLDEDNGEENEF